MNKLLVFIAILLGVFGFFHNAEAELKEEGFFLGAGLGYAWEDFDTDELDALGLNVDVDNAWGFNLFAGYNFMKHLAIEGNINWYDDFEVDVGGLNLFDVEIWTLIIDLKAMYPVYSDKLVPYARVGGGYMSAEANISGTNANYDDDDFAVNLGAGLDYFVTEQVSLGLDGKYVWGTGDVDDLQYFVGAVRAGYHF